jgi:hypothetical protein
LSSWGIGSYSKWAQLHEEEEEEEEEGTEAKI